MKLNRKLLVVAMACAMPCMSALAQSPADLQKEIELLKAQLKVLSEKIEILSSKAPAVEPQEFNRLVQKMDLMEESTSEAGFKGLKIKGTMEAVYQRDSNSASTGFDQAKGNGGYGAAMLEFSKEPDEGIGWTLRLIPLSTAGSIIHEASISIPVGTSDSKINAGLTPDYSGYEYSMGHQNPLISNNLLYANTAASNYMGVGMSHTLSSNLTAKWMVGQIDGTTSRKAPGLAYRADYAMGEYNGLGLSGVHFRTNGENDNSNADLMEIDAYHTRGDLTLQGQFSMGRVMGAAMGTGPDDAGKNARWWGVSGLVGYKLTPRLQALARADFIYNRANGGGVYYNDGSYGPELSSDGTAADGSKGANRYALTAGFNYAVNANTQWKTELRFDRSTGYNFTNNYGELTKGNTTVGTSLVVSF